MARSIEALIRADEWAAGEKRTVLGRVGEAITVSDEAA